jgi:hypothetical protein
MRIVWLEDFGEVKHPESYVLAVFKDLLGETVLDKHWNSDEMNLKRKPQALLEFCQKHSDYHEVILCRHYHDFDDMIRQYTVLRDIDAILIDINLSQGVDSTKPVPDGYVSKEGGFYIYNQIIRQGFPDSHIGFLTGQQETVQWFQKRCEEIFMQKPRSFDKNDSEFERLRNWLTDLEEDYLILRRGIIQGCCHVLSKLKERPANEVIRFHHFLDKRRKPEELVNDLKNYLTILIDFWPLRCPNDKKTHYELFVRTLSHDWENAKPSELDRRLDERLFLQALGWIMKNARNWAAHQRVFKSLGEQQVAFLFLVNMRSMFQLDSDVLPFEKLLLRLFRQPLSESELSNLIEKNALNLARSYSSLKGKVNMDKEDAVRFASLLNNLVNNNKVDDSEIRHRLFQMFWHGFSSVQLQNATTGVDRKTKIHNSGVWYTFHISDYGRQNPASFLFQLARHIYRDSKLESSK